MLKNLRQNLRLLLTGPTQPRETLSEPVFAESEPEVIDSEPETKSPKPKKIISASFKGLRPLYRLIDDAPTLTRNYGAEYPWVKAEGPAHGYYHKFTCFIGPEHSLLIHVRIPETPVPIQIKDAKPKLVTIVEFENNPYNTSTLYLNIKKDTGEKVRERVIHTLVSNHTVRMVTRYMRNYHAFVSAEMFNVPYKKSPCLLRLGMNRENFRAKR